MEEPLKALTIVEGVIQVLEDERGDEERPRIAAAIASLERACELLGSHVDALEGGAEVVHAITRQ